MDPQSLHERIKELENENQVLRKRLLIEGLDLKSKESPPKKAPRLVNVDTHIPLELFTQLAGRLRDDQKNEILVGYQISKKEILDKGIGSRRKDEKPLELPQLCAGFTDSEAFASKRQVLQVHKESAKRVAYAQQLIGKVLELTDELKIPRSEPLSGKITTLRELIKRGQQNDSLGESYSNKATRLINELTNLMMEHKNSGDATTRQNLLIQVRSLREKLDSYLSDNEARIIQSSPETFKCSKCPEETYNCRETATAHLHAKHSNSPKRTCPYCQEQVSVCNNSFSRHVKSCRLSKATK